MQNMPNAITNGEITSFDIGNVNLLFFPIFALAVLYNLYEMYERAHIAGNVFFVCLFVCLFAFSVYRHRRRCWFSTHGGGGGVLKGG
jgi:hypothetical protein